jgi:predicted transcriptional regulator
MAFPVSKLEAKRREKFMSQWDLARSTGIVQTRLSLIERGEIKPKQQEFEAISKALGISSSEVLALLYGGNQVAQELKNGKQ